MNQIFSTNQSILQQFKTWYTTSIGIVEQTFGKVKQKNLFSARFKSLYQTLVSKFEVDACSKINFGNAEQSLGKVKPIKAFVLQDSNLPTKPWYSWTEFW